jgi:hypothetical protein
LQRSILLDIMRTSSLHFLAVLNELNKHRCNVKLPIPDIKVQEAIVTIYHTLEIRKRINVQLKNTSKPLCSVLMKGVVENIASK